MRDAPTNQRRRRRLCRERVVDDVCSKVEHRFSGVADLQVSPALQFAE